MKVFAGQRDDPFFVDLGSVFDLAGLRPFNASHLIPLGATAGVDGVAGYNTHSIAIQVPIRAAGEDRRTRRIGVYASASRQKISILKADGDDRRARPAGVQVSRLGEPADQRGRDPAREEGPLEPVRPEGRRAVRVELHRSGGAGARQPALPGGAGRAHDRPRRPRRGAAHRRAGLNFTGDKKADLLRLNTSIAPSGPVGTGNRLGVLAGEFAGFPNGRRLEDDVTDIEVRALACGYGDVLAGALGLCNLSPNNLLGDGVDANEKPFGTTFPYLASPHQGYDHGHHGA